jgi:Uma2 family endonuclease
MAHPATRRVTVAEFLPLVANEEQLELVDGVVEKRAAPQPSHGLAQGKLTAVLDPYNRRPGGPRGPGGWWLMTEVDTLYARTEEVFRHDAQGYRLDLHSEMPTGFPCPVVPEWVCEILSPGSARVDWMKKQRTLHAHRVPHYWVIDPAAGLLTVLRHSPEGYVLALTAGKGDVVRAEPFDGIELAVGDLLGEE